MLGVGDKVILDPCKCTRDDLEDYGSTGTFDVIYTILEIDEGDDDVVFETENGIVHNYHQPEWLMRAKEPTIVIGGE